MLAIKIKSLLKPRKLHNLSQVTQSLGHGFGVIRGFVKMLNPEPSRRAYVVYAKASIHYTTTHIPDAHVTSGHLRTLPSFVVVKRRGTCSQGPPNWDLPTIMSNYSCPTTGKS